MTLPDINQLFESKIFISFFSVAVGGLVTNLITVLRSRVKTLEYTVNHSPIAFSSDDDFFGAIRVTWQNHDVKNLFSSRVELENQTGKDFTNLKIKVYTGDTMLLNERTEIPGTTYNLRWTDEFDGQVRVANGATPTAQQYNTYNHSREYIIPILNRGQRVVMTYLTTVPSGSVGPGIWLDMQHEGALVQYRQAVPQVHGVPVRVAISIGLVTCLVVFVTTSLLIIVPWVAAVICMVFGLLAQSIGAFIYRTLRFLKPLLVAK